MESFLRSHVLAFRYLGGVARRHRYDNLKSAVVDRHGSAVRFNQNLLEFAGHYRFEPSACNPYSGHEKGKVERNIRYVRDNFFAGRHFRSLEDANEQLLSWLETEANGRMWAEDRSQSVRAVWTAEKERLLAISEHDYPVIEQRVVRSGKTPYVRYDLNDYSIPFDLVQKPLTLLADDKLIRFVDDGKEVASHERSWSRGERITNREHFAGLYERRPGGHTVAVREYLSKAVNGVDEFFALMVRQGEGLGGASARLTELLHEYGEKILAQALAEASVQGIGRPVYVARLCQQLHSQGKERPIVPLDLSDRPELQRIIVKPHDLKDYDNLTEDKGNNCHD